VFYILAYLLPQIATTLAALDTHPSAKSKPIYDDLHSRNPIVSGMFILEISRGFLVPVTVITGRPFKQPFYCNPLLMLLVLVWLPVNVALLATSPGNPLHSTLLGDTALGVPMRLAVGVGSLAALLACFLF
jgi:hypothetical protein